MGGFGPPSFPMAFTVQNVLDDFAEAYPNVSAARQLTLFLRIYREVMNTVDAEQDLQTENLTDGTREYELSYDPILVNIKQVLYVESATSSIPLTAVTVDWMDAHISQWRTTTDTGTPSRYYIRWPDSSGVTTEGKLVIGLDPIPDTTTSTGYPILHLYGSEFTTLAATDKIPSRFSSMQVFVEGMKARYAANRDHEKHDFYRRNFEHELHKEKVFQSSQTEDVSAPRLEGVWMHTTKVE